MEKACHFHELLLMRSVNWDETGRWPVGATAREEAVPAPVLVVLMTRKMALLTLPIR